MEGTIDMQGVPQGTHPNTTRTPSLLSPAKRPAALSGGAVIQSPVVMQSTHHGTTAASASAGISAEDASPVSSYTAAEYEEIERKQCELRSAVEQRISTLENVLRRREEELEAVRIQLLKTEEDYQFNYNLIGERDRALAEAAAQVQLLYGELKRYKSENVVATKRLEELEQEAQCLRQRLREVEEEKEQTLQATHGAYEVREKHLKEDVHKKNVAMEREKQRLHDEYLKRFKALDDARAELEAKGKEAVREVEERWKQDTSRLEAELRTAVDAMEVLRREKVEKEDHLTATSKSLSILKQEHELLQQRLQTSIADASEQKRMYEQRVAECNAAMGQGIASAEGTARQQVQRACELESECSRLQGQLTELRERLQTVEFQRDEEARRFIIDGKKAQENYDRAAAQAEEQRRSLDETQRQLNLKLQQLECDLEITREAKKEAICRIRECQERCDNLQSERTQQQCEVERLRRELQQSRDEEQLSASRVQEIQRLADEKVLAASRDVEFARSELQSQQRRLFDLQERAQAEVARLTRELHASEAARHAVEEQYRLVEDANGHMTLIETLRSDKETLERKVLDLERANAAIREQVSSFTIELQNDPTMKTAKEMQNRVRELQDDLLRAREETDKLRDALREKEEEISHYRLKSLRGCPESSTGRKRQNLRGTHCHAHVGEDCCLIDDFKVNQGHGHIPRGKRENTPSSSKVVICAEGSSNSSGEINRDEEVPPSRGRACGVRNVLHKDQALIREVESLRRKCLHLEQGARTLLRERDDLERELLLTRKDVEALTSEKQSLVDLNSLLKVQLREAYRTALECSRQQKRQQSVDSQALTTHVEAGAATSVKHPGRGGRPNVDNELCAAGATRTLSLDGERFAALEEDLAAIKAHILNRRLTNSQAPRRERAATSPEDFRATAREPSKEQMQRRVVSAAPPGRSASREKVPVVKRRSGAVRHYGYL